MNSFDFQAKTEIYFGKGREEEVGKILKKGSISQKGDNLDSN